MLIVPSLLSAPCVTVNVESFRLTVTCNYKLNQIRGFLTDGCKVKLTLQYRGRENAHRELGEDVINRVLEELRDEIGRAHV